MSTRYNRNVPALCPDGGPTLRQQAETAIQTARAPVARSPEETELLLHELHVHQVELELQNEELRRTQEELESSRARYFALYDLAPVGYVTLSPQGLIQEANLTIATVLQVPRSSLHRQPLSRFIAPEDHDIYYQHQRRLATTSVPQASEVRLVRADRAPFWARLESTMAQDAASEAAVYRTVISDISVRVQAEAALREVNAALTEREERLSATNAELVQALKLKDEILVMMSHELRTPLNVVLGFSEAMIEGLYGPLVARQREVLGTVMQSGRHLLALISDILDLARIAVGREQLELEPVAVESLCRTALLYVLPAAERKGIQLRHTVTSGITGIEADERRLTQILVNLLTNAVKFTPEGGTVGLEVRVDLDQAQIAFSVWDSGIGIATADHAQLFEPFTQVDRGLGRQYDGVGLGLALVRRLTELHGGSVFLESALGQGSRFTVSLPLSPRSNVALRGADGLEASPPSWPAPPRIVLVDDHAPSLALVAEWLTQQECQVATVRTGEEAVALVRATPPDVVVLDIQLPGMDGLTAIRQMRADSALAALPIIVLTALAMPGDRERCLATGANA